MILFDNDKEIIDDSIDEEDIKKRVKKKKKHLLIAIAIISSVVVLLVFSPIAINLLAFGDNFYRSGINKYKTDTSNTELCTYLTVHQFEDNYLFFREI